MPTRRDFQLERCTDERMPIRRFGALCADVQIHNPALVGRERGAWRNIDVGDRDATVRHQDVARQPPCMAVVLEIPEDMLRPSPSECEDSGPSLHTSVTLSSTASVEHAGTVVASNKPCGSHRIGNVQAV